MWPQRCRFFGSNKGFALPANEFSQVNIRFFLLDARKRVVDVKAPERAAQSQNSEVASHSENTESECWKVM